MIGLIQRVTEAGIVIDGRTTARIGAGLLVLAGVEKADTPVQSKRLAQRLCQYRVFPDPQGRMNLSVADIAGDILAVPQFTLAADTSGGNRASFSSAAEPGKGRVLYEKLVAELGMMHPGKVATGLFGADMQVSLVNDGPVTFWLRVAPTAGN